jgi:NAD(P)-dependent dehydrogenase (short-subunit alcohol dehydrogenase family)
MTAPDLQKLFDMTDRVVLITGGSRGLGMSMGRGFAAAGAKVVLSSRKLEACEEAAAAIGADGGDATAIACHMGEVEQVRALVEDTVALHGRLDVVVNNAANPLRFGITDATEVAWDKSHDVNLRGPLFLMQAALPHLKASPSATDPDKGGAAIVNVLSVGGFYGTPGQIAYGSAKAALWHLTRSAAKEFAPHRIRVNAIAPGPFATYMVTSGGDDFMERTASITAQKRLADPDEIIGPALLLGSDAGSFVTGSCVTVDGGSLA